MGFAPRPVCRAICPAAPTLALSELAFRLQAGPSKAMNWYSVPGNSTVPAGPRGTDTDAVNGDAVMYDAAAGKIFTCGGATCYSGTVRSALGQPCT